MKKIPLTNGGCTLVDDWQFERLNKNQWAWKRRRGTRTKYVYRRVRLPDGRRPSIYMHREIVGTKRGETVDHQDHDGLNNQESNLRKCTQRQNVYNSRKYRRPTQSQYRGVGRVPPRVHKTKPWVAKIHYKGMKCVLGYFLHEDEAAIAYNAAAQILFGPFASLNPV